MVSTWWARRQAIMAMSVMFLLGLIAGLAFPYESLVSWMIGGGVTGFIFAGLRDLRRREKERHW